ADTAPLAGILPTYATRRRPHEPPVGFASARATEATRTATQGSAMTSAIDLQTKIGFQPVGDGLAPDRRGKLLQSVGLRLIADGVIPAGADGIGDLHEAAGGLLQA